MPTIAPRWRLGFPLLILRGLGVGGEIRIWELFNNIFLKFSLLYIYYFFPISLLLILLNSVLVTEGGRGGGGERSGGGGGGFLPSLIFPIIWQGPMLTLVRL